MDDNYQYPYQDDWLMGFYSDACESLGMEPTEQNVFLTYELLNEDDDDE